MRCPPQLHQNHISWIDIPLKHAQEAANIPYWLGSNVQSAFQTYCTTIVAHETLVRLPKAGRACCQCESEHGAVSIEAENTWAKNTASSSKRFMCHRLLRFWPQPRNRHALALLPSRESMHPSWPRHVTLPSPGELPGWRDLGCATASELRCNRGRPRCSDGPRSTPSKGFEIQP